MNHYMSLAVVGVRLMAILLLVIGGLGLIYVALIALLVRGMSPENWDRLSSSIAYSVAGVIVYVLSKPIGRLVGKGL